MKRIKENVVFLAPELRVISYLIGHDGKHVEISLITRSIRWSSPQSLLI